MTPEQWLEQFKIRFGSEPKLHEGVQWIDVERSLKADPDSMKKIMNFDAKGHEMNIIRESSTPTNTHFTFVSTWSDYQQVSPDHRGLTYDETGEKIARNNPNSRVKGNILDVIAKTIRIEKKEADKYLAYSWFHQLLAKVKKEINGSAWFHTDETTLSEGGVWVANHNDQELHKMPRSFHAEEGSFRAQVRIRKI